jgi:hypothetical protein
MMWFSYDPNGDGFDLHDSEDAARKSAEAALEAERENARDGWDEDAVLQICWGLIIGRVEEVERRPVEDGDGLDGSKIDEFVDYGLVEDGSPTVPAPPVSRAGQQGSGSGDYPPPQGSPQSVCDRCLDRAD